MTRVSMRRRSLRTTHGSCFGTRTMPRGQDSRRPVAARLAPLTSASATWRTSYAFTGSGKRKRKVRWISSGGSGRRASAGRCQGDQQDEEVDLQGELRDLVEVLQPAAARAAARARRRRRSGDAPERRLRPPSPHLPRLARAQSSSTYRRRCSSNSSNPAASAASATASSTEAGVNGGVSGSVSSGAAHAPPADAEFAAASASTEASVSAAPVSWAPPATGRYVTTPPCRRSSAITRVCRWGRRLRFASTVETGASNPVDTRASPLTYASGVGAMESAQDETRDEAVLCQYQ